MKIFFNGVGCEMVEVVVEEKVVVITWQ